MATPDYSQLTPDCVLNALERIGLRCDGRLLALNSYENRVYQVGMDDGAARVAQFYRPARWSDEAILEEHAFVQELVEREIPVVPASVIDGRTLHQFEGFRNCSLRFSKRSSALQYADEKTINQLSLRQQ